MAFFSKPQKDDTQAQAPRNPSNVIAFRVLAIGYLIYLCSDLVKLYNAGGSDAPSLTMLIIGIAVLGGGALFLALIAYKEWKRTKVEYDAYMAELRAEAEAKRAAEEAEEDCEEEEYFEEEDLEEEEDLLLPEQTEDTQE